MKGSLDLQRGPHSQVENGCSKGRRVTQAGQGRTLPLWEAAWPAQQSQVGSAPAPHSSSISLECAENTGSQAHPDLLTQNPGIASQDWGHGDIFKPTLVPGLQGTGKACSDR